MHESEPAINLPMRVYIPSSSFSNGQFRSSGLTSVIIKRFHPYWCSSCAGPGNSDTRVANNCPVQWEETREGKVDRVARRFMAFEFVKSASHSELIMENSAVAGPRNAGENSPTPLFHIPSSSYSRDEIIASACPSYKSRTKCEDSSATPGHTPTPTHIHRERGTLTKPDGALSWWR
jgi:hypothetical protein